MVYNYMYIRGDKLDKPDTMFKKRNRVKIWQKNKIFNKKNFFVKKNKYAFIMYNFNEIIELFWYKIFLKKIRKIIKKKKVKGFVSVVNNHSFSIKSKNSRMGKGKGKHTRFVSKQTIFKPVLIFKNLSYQRVWKLKMFLNKKCKNNFYLF